MSCAEISLAKALPAEEKRIHPVEFIQKTAYEQEETLRMNRLRLTQGLGAAAFEGLTEMTLSRARRFGAIPSSATMYHSYHGDFSDISPLDLYGLLENNPCVQPSSRALAEKEIFGHELTVKSLGI